MSVTASKVYDGTTNPIQVPLTVLDFVPGEAASLISAGSYVNKNVVYDADGKVASQPLTLSEPTITIEPGNPFDPKNYEIIIPPATLTIHPAKLTAAVTVADKAYDGGMDAKITSIELHGTFGGDDVQAAGGIARFESAGPSQEPIFVTVTKLRLSGKDAGNYSVDDTATTTAFIKPK